MDMQDVQDTYEGCIISHCLEQGESPANKDQFVEVTELIEIGKGGSIGQLKVMAAHFFTQ